MVAKVIQKYLFSKNISPVLFAHICKVTKASVYRWLNGEVKELNRSIALRVERATRGEIPYESLTTSPRKKIKK